MTDGTSSSSSSQKAGIILLLLAGALWSLNGALIKLVDREGVHAVAIACYRSLFAGLFLVPFARGKWSTLLRPGTGPPVFRIRRHALACVVFFTLMTASFVAANTLTEAANAIILQYTSTFWIFGLSPWVLREKPHAKDIQLLFVAMLGIIVIFAGNASADLLGLFFAMSAGLFYALLTLMIRQLRDADSAAVTVLNNLGSALLLLPIAWIAGGLMVSWWGFVLLLLLGVVQFGIPYYLYALALARVPAYQAALLTMIEPVLVPVWTYLAVREHVPIPTAIGGGVIMLALILFVRRSRARAAEVLAEARALEA